MKTATIHNVSFEMEDELYQWYTRPSQMEVGPGSIWHWKLEMILEMASFQQACRENQFNSFLDVGAHCGIFSTVYCSLVSAHKCHSVEPVIGHVERINSIAKTNGFNMTGHHLAFGAEDRIVRYDNDHMARWIDELDHAIDRETLNEVRQMPLDDFVAIHGQPDLIKIDTEGYEVPILRGARETLDTGVTLFMETHIDQSESLGHDLSEIVELLSGYEFRTNDNKPIKDLHKYMLAGQNQHFVARG